MKHLYSLLLIILFLSISCNRSKTAQEVSEKSDSLKTSSNRIVSSMGETLIPKAKKAISDWEEYNDVDEFIIKYYNISTIEALDYAEELSSLVQLMKDSVNIDILKEKNITARFNVLHNETLRLADMATISSITNEEVNEEVKKIVEVYSAMNSKINTIYKAIELQESLDIDTETPIEIFDEPKTYKNRSLRRSNKLREKKSEKKSIKKRRVRDENTKPQINKLVKPATLTKKPLE